MRPNHPPTAKPLNAIYIWIERGRSPTQLLWTPPFWSCITPGKRGYGDPDGIIQVREERGGEVGLCT
jgi:hypothetical protein